MRSPKPPLTLGLIILAITLFQMPAYAQDTQAKRKHSILIAAPFLEIGDWEVKFHNTFHQAMNSGKDIQVGISYVSIGSDLIGRQVSEEEAIGNLIDKIRKADADIVVFLFHGLHQFVYDHRDRFDRGLIKIFIPAVESFQDRLREIPNSYIIKSSSGRAMERTLGLIRQMLPGLEHLYITAGSGTSDLPFVHQARGIIGKDAEPIDTEFLIGENFETLLSKLRTLPGKSAIFYLPMNRDKDDNVIPGNSVFPAYASAASAPIFVFTDTFLGLGVVGGDITSAEVYASYTADAVKKIISGDPPRATEDDFPTKAMFDWQMLQKWGIDASRLPPGAAFINREYSFFELYWRETILAGALFILQSALIIVLILLFAKSKKLQGNLMRSVGEKELLLREIHHRVKNNMAIILSFIDMQASKEESKGMGDSLIALKNRIHSMALIHEQIYNEDDLTRIDYEDYFTKLVHGVVASYGCSNKVHIELSIAKLELPLDRVINLSIIVNELVTNSIKHALPATESLTIGMRLDHKPDRKLITLRVYDDGPGFPDLERVQADAGSIGIITVDALVSQIRGRIARSNDPGASTYIEFEDTGP